MNMNEEVWKVVKEFPNYMISNMEQVWNCKKNKLMVPSKTTGGYLRLTLYHNGNKESKYVAHLVARAFLPKLGYLCTVDHINRNQRDNRAENLRFATSSEQGSNRSYYNACGIRGVSQNSQKWKAEIRYKGKLCYLGSYDTKEEAGLFYDAFAWMLYKDFAVLEAGIPRVYTDEMKIKIGKLIERHNFKI